jgi:RTA1 like protein
MILILLLHIKPRVLTLWRGTYWGIFSLFFTVIISLTAQGSASYFNPTASVGSVKSGHILLDVALCFMLALAVLFLGLVTEYHRRVTKSTISAADNPQASLIKKIVWTLYTTGLLMLARDIFRTVQIFSPTDSLGWTSEALFWVFEATPLLLVLYILNIVHPLRNLKSPGAGAC